MAGLTFSRSFVYQYPDGWQLRGCPSFTAYQDPMPHDLFHHEEGDQTVEQEHTALGVWAYENVGCPLRLGVPDKNGRRLLANALVYVLRESGACSPADSVPDVPREYAQEVEETLHLAMLPKVEEHAVRTRMLVGISRAHAFWGSPLLLYRVTRAFRDQRCFLALPRPAGSVMCISLEDLELGGFGSIRIQFSTPDGKTGTSLHERCLSL
ncbi:hypothetical protein EBT31_03970 [bacterium]|nr:hypothetical protein [bacterium]